MTIDERRGLDDITGAVIDASIRIHRNLGPAVFESVYETVLARTLEVQGFRVQRQQGIRFEYEGMVFEEGFRADLIVNGVVLVELKAVDRLKAVHARQILTYLRLSGLPVGLLINFGGGTLREGLMRFVNDLPPSDSPLLRVNRRGSE
jgi:GxxExxY protein